ncbi:MAG: BatD family protein [Verrucomicrobia subdivision 3 bacterium]|nr:BatD family protein [Limisphaerales bacterium]
MRGLFLILVCLGNAASAAVLTSTLNPGAIQQTGSAVLTVRCDGYELATVHPERTPAGMGFSFRGREVNRSTLNGSDKLSVTFTYLVTTSKAGRHIVPAFTAKLPNGTMLRSEPLALTVLDRDGSSSVANQNRAAFIKVQLDRSQVYLGQAFPVTMELFVERLLPGDLPVPQLTTPGFRFTRKRPEFSHTLRLENGSRYHVFLFKTGAVATKVGRRNMVFEIDVTVRDSDDFFGKRKQIHVASNPIAMEVMPVPAEGRPENFSGAVGSNLQFKVKASHAAVKTGDPLELSIELSGRAALDQITVPGPDQWDGLKVYPATSTVKHLDLRHLHAFKTFTRTVVPLRPDITEIPQIEFVYFDTGTKQYITHTAGPFPLRVTGPAIQTAAGDPPTLPQSQTDPQADAGKMEPLRRTPGLLATAPTPLLTHPWFLIAQSAPLLAWVMLMGWRRRQTYLEQHPDVVRRIHVQKVTRETLRSLRQTETQADPEAFHAGVQLILREHLGMAMGRPAEGIGREILEDETLPLSGENRTALERLHEHNQLARFTGSANPPETVKAPLLLKDLERVIHSLR